MRKPVAMCSPFLATLALAPLALAATYYVSPTGTATTGCTSRGTPCDLVSGVGLVAPGDTVMLMDGIYKSQIDVKTSGTSSAWITFQADECATPIIEGTGTETDTGVDAVDQPTGVGSSTATYIRYNGLISRGWNTGFGNHWTGNIANDSNGNVEYKYCIADSNGRTGFTFYSAAGLHIQNCISAHNGSSAPHSWSSGITLYSASGTLLIEGTLSFENMDAQKHTDGSGFIVDESTNNATFQNNIAFGNGGSCFRLTKSSGTKFLNNTCYHNAQDPADTGPTNPGEIYFTDTSACWQGISFMNNAAVATGVSPRGSTAVINQPTSGWTSNNVSTGSASFFTSPDGTNPDFTLSSSSALKGAGSSGGPSNDIGFNPKCVTKRAPTLLGSYSRASWWNYSVDVDYIKSIGGVAKCFTPKSRSGAADIGAYANGAVTTAAACVPPSTGGSSSTGGTKATGGASSTGGSVSAGGTASTGGSKATGGSSANAGSKATGGSSANAGSKATGGASSAAGGANAGGASNANTGGGNVGGASVGGASVNGGNSSASTGGSAAVAGNAGTPAGGASANVGGGAPVGGVSGDTGGNEAAAGASGAGNSSNSGGCGCRVAGSPARSGSLAALGLLGLAMLRITRRRPSR
jgi:MYXO-CTERM domain-containing protein